MFLTAREVRSVFISIYHDSGSKPRGSRSLQRQQQEARTFVSNCFPDILVNVAPICMNAACLFVLRTYMYSMPWSTASSRPRPSVTEPGNEDYRRIYPLKNFRRYARTTKILLHEKRTPENFTTRKFSDLR